jgi:hypothetical protein
MNEELLAASACKKLILYFTFALFTGRIDMKLKFERCTAESLVEMFRHYFDTDLPEGGTHTIHQSLSCYKEMSSILADQ